MKRFFVVASLCVLAASVLLPAPCRAGCEVFPEQAVFGSGGGEEKNPCLSLKTVTFPNDTFLIPFDSHQNDILKAFGFVHAALRNYTNVYRIIEPMQKTPGGNVTIKTQLYPAGDVFYGGPILMMPSSSSLVTSLKTAFPTVSVDKTTEVFMNQDVYVVGTPTNILISVGQYGHTELLLDDMGIPYTLTNAASMTSNPGQLADYNLFVDDCAGMDDGFGLPQNLKDAITSFVNNGNELIYTDIGIVDSNNMPWSGYMTPSNTPQYDVVQSWDFHNWADFPGQYAGPASMKLYQMYGGCMATTPIDPRVKVMVDTQTYDGSPGYRIAAAYWYWGESNGVVEFFAYHPFEQTFAKTGDANSYKMASFLYGNKFLHMAPVDTGILSKNSKEKGTIALEGSTGDPAQEQEKITISVQALGADVTYDYQMKVHYELMPYINAVNGTFMDQYGATKDPMFTTNPNGSKSLRWIISSLPTDSYWNVSFKITSMKVGQVYVNAASRSNVTYTDLQGKFRVMQLVPLKITVTGPVGEPIALIVSAGSFCAAAATIVYMRKRRK